MWQYEFPEDEIKIAAGYEIREDQLDFNLPYFAEKLPSGDSLHEICGDMIYTITLSGGLCEEPVADCSEIVIT